MNLIYQRKPVVGPTPIADC